MNLNDIGNNLRNLWSQGTQAVGNLGHAVSNEVQQLPNQIQQVAQPVEQAATHIQIPQQAINFGNLASSFAQHLGQTISSQPAVPQIGKLSPTVGQVAQNITQMAQAIPRSGYEAAQTLAGDMKPYQPQGAEQAVFGSQPLRNFNDPNRPSGQFARAIGQPGLTAPLAVVGAVAADLPFGLGAKSGGQEAINLAKQAGTVEDFTKALQGAKPEVQQAVNAVIKDPKAPINSVQDFFNTVKGSGSSPVGKTIGAMQQAHQSPDLTAYEKAFNSGDTKTLDKLAAANPNDARFQVHTQLPQTQYAKTGTVPTQAAIRARVAQPTAQEKGSPFYSGPQVGVTSNELKQYIQNISKDPQFNNYLKINNGDENRAVARVLEDRLSNGKVPKDIMQSIYSNTPSVQDMETGELLNPMDSFRGEHARSLMENLNIDNVKGNTGQPNPQEQGSIQDFEKNVMGNGKVDNFNKDIGVQTNNPNIKVKAPPENPNGGVAAVNPQEVAQQARLARSGTMQNIQYRAQTLASQMQQVLKTPEDNLNIRLAIENPAKMEEYASQSSNPQAFKQVAQQYSDFTDHVAKQIQASGNKMGYINNYFTHIWDLSTPEAQQTWNDLMAANAKNFTSGFTKDRLVNTIQEGLSKGLTLKNPQAAQDVVQYANSIGMQAGAGAFNKTINDLRPSGAVPFSANGTVPYNYEGKLFQQSKVPGNEGTFIDPELQKYMSHYNPSGFADNPIIAGGKPSLMGKTLPFRIPGVEQLNQLDKESKLALGGFHALNTSLRMAANNPTVIPSAIRSMFDSGYRNQLAQKAIDDGVIDFGTKHGVTFSSSGDLLPQGATTLQQIGSKNPINKVNNALFGGMINTYKQNLVRGMMSKFANADTDPIVAKQEQEYGKQINDLMGGLNYEAMGRNKTVQQALRLVGLAPDFTEGTLHQLFTAANPKNYANITTRPAAIFALRNVLGQVAIYAGLAELGRKLTTGNFSPDFKSFVANSILNPNIPLPNNSTFNNPKTGKTQSAFLPASELNTLAKGVTDPLHFLQARGSGVVSAGGSLASGKDYYGNPLVNPFSGQQDNLQNRAAALLPNQLPIPVQQILKATQKTQVTSNPNAPKVPIQTPATTALNIAGFRVANNPNDPKTIAQTKYFNGLNQTAQSLNPNDQKIFLGQIHPTTKDADGNPVVDKNPLTSPAKYDTLLSNPSVLAAEVAFQRSQPNHDPLWDLNPAQLKAYMQAQAISKNDPGGDKATVNALYKAIPQSFYDQRTQFFNKLVSSGQMSPQAVNQYKVAANPAVSQFWNNYFALPAGSAQRKAMINSPLGQQALQQTQQQTQLTNQQRLDMGLPLLAGSSSGYSKYSKGAKKVSIKAVGAGTVPKLGAFKILSTTKKANLSNKLGTSKTNSIKMAKQPSLKALKVVAGTKPLSGKKTSAFKVTTPRILLSAPGSSQRGVRKQAGISIPRTRRRVPYLTV